VSLGRVEVTLHDGGARRAVVDDLDQDAVRHDDGDGPAMAPDLVCWMALVTISEVSKVAASQKRI
jgi:hypothetical protein